MNNENEEFNDLSLDDVSGYQLPAAEDIVLDLANNKVLDNKSLSPIQMIYLTAKQKGIELKEFPINEKGFIDSGCRKKGCWGRGYKGWNGLVPVPCECLFNEAQKQSDGSTINRKIVRNYHKVIRSEQKEIIQKKAKEHGLNPTNEYYDNAGEYRIYSKVKKGTKEVLKYIWKDYTHEGKKNWDFRRIDTMVAKTVEEETD